MDPVLNLQKNQKETRFFFETVSLSAKLQRGTYVAVRDVYRYWILKGWHQKIYCETCQKLQPREGTYPSCEVVRLKASESLQSQHEACQEKCEGEAKKFSQWRYTVEGFGAEWALSCCSFRGLFLQPKRWNDAKCDVSPKYWLLWWSFNRELNIHNVTNSDWNLLAQWQSCTRGSSLRNSVKTAHTANSAARTQRVPSKRSIRGSTASSLHICMCPMTRVETAGHVTPANVYQLISCCMMSLNSNYGACFCTNHWEISSLQHLKQKKKPFHFNWLFVVKTSFLRDLEFGFNCLWSVFLKFGWREGFGRCSLSCQRKGTAAT